MVNGYIKATNYILEIIRKYLRPSIIKGKNLFIVRTSIFIPKEIY